MKLLVPLMMPTMLRMRLAASPSRRALMMGMPPATAASNCTMTLCFSASAKSSPPCSASSFLLAVTMCLPWRTASNTSSLAMPVPPKSSTTISTSGRRTTSNGSAVIRVPSGQRARALASSRVDTIKILTPRPRRRAISAALPRNTSTVPLPTVPKPKMPIFTGFIAAPC